MSLILDEHREYLSDEVRLSCFRNAIAEVVHPGDIVVDLGAGTGVLGLFACQAGAARVYSIEHGPIVSLAQQICRANGFADRISFIKSLSLKAEVPQRADVVIADQIGFFGFEAGILEYFSDARHRFLLPGGKMIPSNLELWAAPVEIPELYANVDFWNKRPANLDFSPASSVAVNTLNSASFETKHLLSEPQRLASLDLSTATNTVIKMKSTCRIERIAQLHGIGGWFSAKLSPSVTMTNSPVESSRIGRKNAFLPLERPLKVRPGDRVDMAVHIVPGEGLISWNLDISRDENSTQTYTVAFRQSTFKGMLLREDDLRHTQPKFVPKLTSWGDARLSVLRLCDGHRQLTDIEAEVYRRHTQLFRSPSEVASFVAGVVAHYSQ
jgi:Ribosomal protein L11 methyltransferase (PrmA)